MGQRLGLSRTLMFGKMNVVEMRMQRWICGHTRRHKIKNKDVRDRVGANPMMDQMREVKLKWLGHVRRRCAYAPVTGVRG